MLEWSMAPPPTATDKVEQARWFAEEIQPHESKLRGWLRARFTALSLSIEPLAAGEKDYVVVTCDMAKADWVQTSTEGRNPCLGKSMPARGEPRKITAAPGHGCGGAAPARGHDGHAQHGCG